MSDNNTSDEKMADNNTIDEKNTEYMNIIKIAKGLLGALEEEITADKIKIIELKRLLTISEERESRKILKPRKILKRKWIKKFLKD